MKLSQLTAALQDFIEQSNYPQDPELVFHTVSDERLEYDQCLDPDGTDTIVLVQFKLVGPKPEAATP